MVHPQRHMVKEQRPTVRPAATVHSAHPQVIDVAHVRELYAAPLHKVLPQHGPRTESHRRDRPLGRRTLMTVCRARSASVRSWSVRALASTVDGSAPPAPPIQRRASRSPPRAAFDEMARGTTCCTLDAPSKHPRRFQHHLKRVAFPLARARRNPVGPPRVSGAPTRGLSTGIGPTVVRQQPARSRRARRRGFGRTTPSSAPKLQSPQAGCPKHR
jgi:hypothetical protein